MIKEKTGAGKERAPLPREIRSALDKIRETDFWLCVQFADTLIRYLEITMKKDSVTDASPMVGQEDREREREREAAGTRDGP